MYFPTTCPVSMRITGGGRAGRGAHLFVRADAQLAEPSISPPNLHGAGGGKGPGTNGVSETGSGGSGSSGNGSGGIGSSGKGSGGIGSGGKGSGGIVPSGKDLDHTVRSVDMEGGTGDSVHSPMPDASFASIHTP